MKTLKKEERNIMNKFNYIILCLLLVVTLIYSIDTKKITYDQMIKDVRQLASILESSHPDPYINGGGKIKFHQKFQKILNSIPESGMSKSEFFRLIGPFAASVGDAHTSIYDAYSDNWESPGGIPLYFKVVEKSLYVHAVPEKKYIHLIGSVLISVNDIMVSELIERQQALKGCDNDYTALNILEGTGYLFFKDGLHDLIPEWKDSSKLRIKLKHTSGEILEHVFYLPVEVSYPFIKQQSSVKIPSTKKCDFAYNFMDKEKQIAFLKIKHMTGYREDFELSGTSHTMDGLHKAWKRFHGTKPPEKLADIVAGIPSAAELFKSLIDEMKKSKTKTLIVDLRDNNGGNSMMMDFLWYFLFGKEKCLWLKGETATDITKLSDLYFKNRPNASIEKIQKDLKYPINKNDYDFRYNCFRDLEKLKSLNVGAILEHYYKMMPSFYSFYNSDQKESFYTPDKILVLCSPGTFSGGYELMWGLYKCGAIIIGTPSGQAGNFFSNALRFKLKNSGLDGQVSSKSQMLFPDDPVKGRVLRPDIELTYEYLKKYKFDPNAAVLLALEKLSIIKTIRN